MNRCPACGIPVSGLTREPGRRVSCWPCGCWLTEEQALPIILARGDNT